MRTSQLFTYTMLNFIVWQTKWLVPFWCMATLQLFCSGWPKSEIQLFFSVKTQNGHQKFGLANVKKIIFKPLEDCKNWDQWERAISNFLAFWPLLNLQCLVVDLEQRVAYCIAPCCLLEYFYPSTILTLFMLNVIKNSCTSKPKTLGEWMRLQLFCSYFCNVQIC